MDRRRRRSCGNCGLFVASELLSLRRDNDASELLDAGVASRDDLVKCASYEMMCNYAPGTITASTIEGAFGFAIEAVRSIDGRGWFDAILTGAAWSY